MLWKHQAPPEAGPRPRLGQVLVVMPIVTEAQAIRAQAMAEQRVAGPAAEAPNAERTPAEAPVATLILARVGP